MNYHFKAVLLLNIISSCTTKSSKIANKSDYLYYQAEIEVDKHPKITIRIDSLDIEGNQYKVNFEYIGKIKQQTGLLQINDTLAVNYIFLKMKINNKNEYFSSINFYKKNDDQNWEEIGWYNFNKNILDHLGWGGFGYRGQTESFFYKIFVKIE